MSQNPRLLTCEAQFLSSKFFFSFLPLFSLAKEYFFHGFLPSLNLEEKLGLGGYLVLGNTFYKYLVKFMASSNADGLCSEGVCKKLRDPFDAMVE